MNAFWQLVRQDVKRAWPTATVLIAAYVVWLMMMYRSSLQPGFPVFETVITRIIPIYIAVGIWHSIQRFSIWNSSRMHLLLSLPTAGMVVTGAAFLVLWLELVAYGLIVFGGASLLSSFSGSPLLGLDGEAVGWISWLSIFLRLLVFIALIAAILISIAQFSWLLGRTFRRYHAPVSIITACGLLWIFLRLGMAIGSWSTWDLPFTLYFLAEGYDVRGLMQITLNMLPLLAMLALAYVLFWLGARLFEARIEV